MLFAEINIAMLEKNVTAATNVPTAFAILSTLPKVLPVSDAGYLLCAEICFVIAPKNVTEEATVGKTVNANLPTNPNPPPAAVVKPVL